MIIDTLSLISIIAVSAISLFLLLDSKPGTVVRTKHRTHHKSESRKPSA